MVYLIITTSFFILPYPFFTICTICCYAGKPSLCYMKTIFTRGPKLLIPCLFLWFAQACQKNVLTTDQSMVQASMQLQISASAIVLVQSNAAVNFVNFTWAALPNVNEGGVNYTLEAAMPGSQFADTVELLSTGQ